MNCLFSSVFFCLHNILNLSSPPYQIVIERCIGIQIDRQKYRQITAISIQNDQYDPLLLTCYLIHKHRQTDTHTPGEVWRLIALQHPIRQPWSQCHGRTIGERGIEGEEKERERWRARELARDRERGIHHSTFNVGGGKTFNFHPIMA